MVARSSDYALALKGNQKVLRKDVAELFDSPPKPEKSMYIKALAKATGAPSGAWPASATMSADCNRARNGFAARCVTIRDWRRCSAWSTCGRDGHFRVDMLRLGGHSGPVRVPRPMAYS